MKEYVPIIKEYKIDQVPFAVSHHLGNPIGAIDSFISLAKQYLERGDIENAKQCLEEADNASEDAKGRIQDFRSGNISFKL